MACDEHRIVAYLAGDLADRERGRFERHLLGCESCWSAVSDDRRGRELAEQLHELAPAGLRDRVRASIELSPAAARSRSSKPHRLRLGLAAGIAAVAAVISSVLALQRPTDPPIVGEVLALASSTRPLPPRAQNDVDGRDVNLARYELDGAPIVMARSDAAFPMPAHAMPLGRRPGEPWVARRNGMSLLCLSSPEHVLLAGHLPPARLFAFAQKMGLTP